LSAGDLPRGKILVVEDEMFMTLDLQRMLREAGFRVAGPATSLTEIQRLIERGPIGCALVDLDVNRRTPLPVADLLAFADVPFVFMTTGGRAYLPQQHAHRPVLKKPFDKAVLVAALERAIRRQAGANDTGQYMIRGPQTWPRVFPSL
jgi:DNA-binding response OmpR family regulator